MKNPEPVPYEQALANAMLWTKKAGQIALDAGKTADAQRLAVAASLIERIYLEGAAVYADEPEDAAAMAMRLAHGAVRWR
jgi:hypothetical protein